MDKAGTQDTENSKLTSSFIRGSAALFAGRIIAIVLKFFIQVLIVRYLSKSDYGAFAYAINMVEIAMIISLFALDRTASRFIPIYDEQEDYNTFFGFIILSLVAIIGLGAAVTVFFMVGQGFLLGTLIEDPAALSLVVILIVLAPIQAIDAWFQSVFAAFGNVKEIFVRRYIVLPLLQLVAVVLVIVLQTNVYWLAVGYLVGGAIGTIMYGMMAYNLLRTKNFLPHFNWKTINFKPREIISFSAPMFFTGFVSIVRGQLAIVFLEFFRDTIAVAEYRAVQPAVNLNMIVYSSFVFMFLPLASRLFARRDDKGIDELYWRTTAWIAIATFPVFIVTFALSQPVVELLFGEQYASSAIIMSIMAFGSYFDSFMGFNKDTLRAYNKVNYLLFVDIVVMITALISFVVLIPQFGAVGGAISFSISIVLTNILYHIGLVRYTGTTWFQWGYLPIYIMIVAFAGGLAAVQAVFSPSIFIGLPVAAVLSLILLRFNASKLHIGEYFPEVMKVPLLKQLLR